MKKLSFLILFGFLANFVFAQSAPLIPSTKITINTVTVFTDPYTVVGTTNDVTSNWVASDISAGDSVYLEDGNELRVYYVQSITSASGTNFTIVINDMNNTGNLPPTGVGALYRGTTNYDFPNFTAGISESLQTLIQNRFVQRLDALIKGAEADYITTDSFNTFVPTTTFAAIPIGKTVLRTTTGSVYQKTSASAMTERTVGNGLLATTKLTQSGTSLTWNSNLNNRVGLNTGANASVTITNPSNLTSQTFGETFVVQVSTSAIPVTVTFDTMYSKFDFTAFGSVNLAAFTEATYSFRVVKSGNKGFKLACTDDLGGGIGLSSLPAATNSTGQERFVMTDSTITLQKLADQIVDSVEVGDYIKTIYAKTPGGPNDYQLGPNSIIVGDTIFTLFASNDDHIEAPHSTSQGIRLIATNAYTGKLIYDELVKANNSTSVYSANCTIANLGGGRRLIFYEVVTQEGVPGSTPRIKETYWRIRNANGTLTAETRINAGYVPETNNGWQVPGSFNFGKDNSWHLTVYGSFNANPVLNRTNYNQLILSSYNQGASWTSRLIVDGTALSIQAEEPTMVQEYVLDANGRSVPGRWLWFLRIDGGGGSYNTINMLYTSGPTDTFNFVSPRPLNRPIEIINGAGYPRVCVFPGMPGKLVLLTRNKADSSFPSLAAADEAVYHVSDNNGQTWAGPYPLDTRNKLVKEKYMYGSVLLHRNEIVFVWAQERGGSSGESDVLFKRVPIGQIGTGVGSRNIVVEKLLSPSGSAPQQFYPNDATPNFVWGLNAMSLTPKNSTTSFPNVAIGRNSLQRCDGCKWNIVMGGDSTGQNITSGRYNIFLGDRLMGGTAGVTGYQNTVINTGQSKLTTGSGNFFAQSLAGSEVTTGSNNFAGSAGALPTLLSGSSNVALGPDAGAGIISGSRNFFGGRTPIFGDISDAVVFGNGTLISDVGLFWHKSTYKVLMAGAGNTTMTGSYILAAGRDALRDNTSGNFLLALGGRALMKNTIGVNNVALAQTNITNRGAGENNTTGSHNLFILEGAGSKNNGNGNIFSGYFAGNNCVGCDNTIVIGGGDNGSGLSLVNADNSTFLGRVPSTADVSNQVGIADGSGNLKFYSVLNTAVIHGGYADLIPSAALAIKSSTGGVMMPSMTTTQRNAIASPATGLQIFNTTTTQHEWYNGSAWVAFTGSGDNLGNHTATTNINMATFAINNASRIISDSINVLNPAFLNAATWTYQNYTSNTPTLNRKGAIYWDGTANGTATTDPSLPDGTLFFVKNNDPSFLLTVAAGSGNTLNGDGRIYPSEGVWFQKHGTVIERITRFRNDYRADLSPTTDANGDFTVTHNLGTTSVAYSFAPICDACRYSFRRKTTSGITSNTIVVRVYDEATGLPLASTSLSVSVMVQRI